MSSIKYKCELKIENFPSRYKLFKELERLIRIRHCDVRYQTINKSNLMIIYSDSPDTILGFAELLTKKKTNVSHYKDMVINVSLSNQDRLIDSNFDEKLKNQNDNQYNYAEKEENDRYNTVNN